MKVLRLEFIRGGEAWAYLAYLSLILVLSVWAMLGWQFYTMQQEVNQWHEAIEHQQAIAKAKLSSTKLSPKDGQQIAEEMKLSKQIAFKLNFPWIGLFNEIGKLKVVDVALLEIDPDPQTSNVRILAEAKDYASMLDFVRKFSTSDQFKEVYLLSYKVDEQAPNKPIKFSVKCVWRLAQ